MPEDCGSAFGASLKGTPPGNSTEDTSSKSLQPLRLELQLVQQKSRFIGRFLNLLRGRFSSAVPSARLDSDQDRFLARLRFLQSRREFKAMGRHNPVVVVRRG